VLEVPTFPDSETEADWAELSCLLKESASRSEIESTLEIANVDDVDSALGRIWQQIEWRHSRFPDTHPVSASGERLEKTKTWEEALPYTFLLLLTCQGFYQSTRITRTHWKQTSKLFESLVTNASKGYLGYAANIGAPRQNSIPKSFDGCLDYICRLTREKKGPKDPLIHWKKDAGVDVVAWRPLDDRCGQIILLVQCAAGEKWHEKVSEIDLRRWGRLVHFAAEPVKGIAFPSVHSCSSAESENRWIDYSCSGGILLDRLRISAFASAAQDNDLRDRMISWCNQQIGKLQWMG
jgi:hypothetical protein